VDSSLLRRIWFALPEKSRSGFSRLEKLEKKVAQASGQVWRRPKADQYLHRGGRAAL
jgi:hypothetical protein